MRTAGLPISQTLGLRQHFCCRCPVLNPGPVLDSSLKTTWGMYFGAFEKPPKRARLASFLVFCWQCFCHSICIGGGAKYQFFTESDYRTCIV